jgi:hypothetical protein
MDRTVRSSRPYTIGLLSRPSSMTTLDPWLEDRQARLDTDSD